MTYFVCDGDGFVGDLATTRGLQELSRALGRKGVYGDLFDDGCTEDLEALITALESASSTDKFVDSTIKNLLALAKKCNDIIIITDGAESESKEFVHGGGGSGNWGHAGRPGERGGSTPGGGGGEGASGGQQPASDTGWQENAKAPAISGIKKVKLTGIKKEALASIQRAADDILVANGCEATSVAWLPDEIDNNPESGATGRCNVKTGEIELSKRFTNDPDSVIKVINPEWERSKSDRFKLARAMGDQRTINALTNCKRWDSYCDAKDPVYANAVHENLHNVVKSNPEILTKFIDGLNARNITITDSFAVSEYACQDHSPHELFSETGACIAAGVPIPDNIRDVFFETGIKIGKGGK